MESVLTECVRPDRVWGLTTHTLAFGETIRDNQSIAAQPVLCAHHFFKDICFYSVKVSPPASNANR